MTSSMVGMGAGGGGPGSDGADPLRREDLVRVFAQAERPDVRTHMVGTELEKFGVRVPTDDGPLLPVDYGDIAAVLAALVAEHGWQPGDDRGVGGEMIELRKNGASITLEPGGQFELSGKPLATIHQTCAEFTEHYRELHAVSLPLGLSWFTAGFHPWATRAQINWMPKGRYRVMREYLPTRGGRGLDMMLRTCTVQANFDYASERQCGERLALANAIAPVLMALFADSPLVEGRRTTAASNRSAVWTDVDPARCGTPDFALDADGFTYERYVDWALDVPMFFVKRDGVYHPHHASFRAFMADGFVDPAGRRHRADYGDWLMHLSTVFPEVRLKPFVEFRSADAVPSRYVCALPALLKGLLYGSDTAAEVRARLGDDATPAGNAALWAEARARGMGAPRIRELAGRLVELARGVLDGFAVRDDKGRTEARFLDPLGELVERGLSPADVALAAIGDDGVTPDRQRAYVRAFYFAGVEV